MKPRDKILLVDDDDDARAMIRLMINRGGFKNTTDTGDPFQAIELIQKGDFDLIILDWKMPKLDGLGVLKEIRTAGISTPVMMLTSEQHAENVQQAIQAGITDYIVKPCTHMTLLKKLSAVVQSINEPS